MEMLSRSRGNLLHILSKAEPVQESNKAGHTAGWFESQVAASPECKHRCLSKAVGYDSTAKWKERSKEPTGLELHSVGSVIVWKSKGCLGPITVQATSCFLSY